MTTEEGNVFSCDSLRATNLTAFQQAVFAKRAMALCRQLSASMPEDLREQSVRSLLESLGISTFDGNLPRSLQVGWSTGTQQNNYRAAWQELRMLSICPLHVCLFACSFVRLYIYCLHRAK